MIAIGETKVVLYDSNPSLQRPTSFARLTRSRVELIVKQGDPYRFRLKEGRDELTELQLVDLDPEMARELKLASDRTG
jgi:hypothetical protein